MIATRLHATFAWRRLTSRSSSSCRTSRRPNRHREPAPRRLDTQQTRLVASDLCTGHEEWLWSRRRSRAPPPARAASRSRRRTRIRRRSWRSCSDPSISASGVSGGAGSSIRLVRPTIHTLEKIAAGLEVHLLDLVTFPEHDLRQAVVDTTRGLLHAELRRGSEDAALKG